jgi:hypothetical protein
MELPYWGPKTVDYLKILVGSQAVAVDSRILRFLGSAGLLISAGGPRAIFHELLEKWDRATRREPERI